jgi:hypothetical protein
MGAVTGVEGGGTILRAGTGVGVTAGAGVATAAWMALSSESSADVVAGGVVPANTTVAMKGRIRPMRFM